ncbi:MAG TPA: hypothetical protein VLR46_13615 [Candidatus Dormibacteraeota bacterium]|nr:hypothetical protein [Candidatus Dormibacteraeota bacterium]
MIIERFGGQGGQLLGADEHRSARIPSMRKRGAQEATTRMAPMGAEDPMIQPSLAR